MDASDSVRGVEPTTKPSGFLERYLAAAVVAFAAGVVILLWIGFALLVRQERSRAIEDVKRENANLARAFAEHTFRTLNYIDQLSFQVTEQYQKLGMNFDMPRYFEENHVDGNLVVNAVISDVSGLTILGSQRGFTPANLADREHIKVHVERDTGKLFIGKPVLARVAKRWSFIATRRVNKADGSYGGVVGIAVDPFYFSTFYKQVDLGRDSLVSLTGTDGIIRARLVGNDNTVGQDVSKGVVFREYGKADHGTLIATSLTDGIRRIYAFHRVQDYPLFVSLGASEAVALADVTIRQRYYFTIALVMSVALLGTAWGLATLWRRQLRYAELALSENERRLSQQNEMLVAVSEAQASYLARGDWKAAAARALRFALDHSESAHGFVGVLVAGPKLRILAHEGVVWNAFASRDGDAQALRLDPGQDYLEVGDFDNFIGVAIRRARTVVVNEVASDARSTPAHEGQPPLKNFLALPVGAGDKVIGIIGLANRPGGYDIEVQVMLERLVGLVEPICDSYLIGLEQERLRAEQSQAEERIRASLEEKEVLLREVHHRVKNNLAIISSLLSLQSSGLTDERAREALRDSQDRVRAMALVHDQLYRSANMSNINFGAHLKELAANVASSYGGAKRGVRLEMNVLNVSLGSRFGNSGKPDFQRTLVQRL